MVIVFYLTKFYNILYYASTGWPMDFLALRDYQYKDFAEEYLGYSLKGSGRFVSLDRKENEIILKIKRYGLNFCDNNEFVFFYDRCVLTRNYWSNVDISDKFEDFVYIDVKQLNK